MSIFRVENLPSSRMFEFYGDDVKVALADIFQRVWA
jgi:hypothetical protein